jgi:hypothetical protein
MMKRSLLFLTILFLVCLAQQAWSDTAGTFDQGLKDRTDWKNWLASLPTGSYRDGAIFWASHRSDPQPPSCASLYSDTPVAGCSDAKARLDPTDRRRKTDPDYRAGSNSYDPQTASSRQPPPPAQPSAPPSSQAPLPPTSNTHLFAQEPPVKQPPPSDKVDDDKPPISVRYKSIRAYSEYLQVTSHIDRVTITGITINQGKCIVVWDGLYGMSWSSHLKFPTTAGFAEDIDFEITPIDDQGKPEIFAWQTCHVIEAVINTDKGSWTFDWDH